MNSIDIHLLEGFFILLYIWSLYGLYLWSRKKRSRYRTHHSYPEPKKENKLRFKIHYKDE